MRTTLPNVAQDLTKKKAFTNVFMTMADDPTCSLRRSSTYSMFFLQAYTSLLSTSTPGLMEFIIDSGLYFTL